MDHADYQAADLALLVFSRPHICNRLGSEEPSGFLLSMTDSRFQLADYVTWNEIYPVLGIYVGTVRCYAFARSLYR
jgi:hypothetical protein